MLEIIFLIFLSGYFIQSIIFSVGVKKTFQRIKENEFLTASVVVAARNEEVNILNCLKSLDELIYPEEKLEIIIVDDKSTGQVKLLMSLFPAKKNLKRSLRKKKSGN